MFKIDKDKAPQRPTPKPTPIPPTRKDESHTPRPVRDGQYHPQQEPKPDPRPPIKK
jgi:hypothetical protein